MKVDRKKGTKLGLEVSDAKAGTTGGSHFFGQMAPWAVKKSKLRMLHVFQYP